MNIFHPGTFVADKLDFNNEVRLKIGIVIAVCSDLFCLAVALLERRVLVKNH
jgi:hypothetical protein